jgi:hypothetical protein
MGYHVLLEFETMAEAKKFVMGVLRVKEVTIDERTFPDDNTEVFETKPVGVWRVPTSFCTCGSSNGWTRGGTYGWWVCSTCHKPTEKWSDNADRWRYALGVNLLPAEVGGIQPEPDARGAHDLNSSAIWRDLASQGGS